MARGIVTPWRTHQDLLEVRRQLYRLGEAEDASDTRHQAVQRVMAWKARGNLPHAVESTALLLDAILHHQNAANSVFSIRAVYSAAFTRFVTGFCDIGRSKERLLEPSSMLDIAKQIDMPVEFVTLRHEATHQELPEIHRLVSATEDALDWLWAVYWSRLEGYSAVGGESAGSLPIAQYKSDAKLRLREYRGQRLEALRSKQSNSSNREQEARKSARVFADSMALDGNRVEAFIGVLLEDKLLLPSKREIGAPLGGAYLIWDPLLQEISWEKKRFLQTLISGMLSLLQQVPTRDADRDSDAEALCLWLLHFVDPLSWTTLTAAEKQLIRTHVVKWCCTNPGHWSHYLGTSMARTGGEDFEAVWSDILDASLLGLRVGGSSNSDAPAEVQGPAAGEGFSTIADDQAGMHGEGGIVPFALPVAGGDGSVRANWIRQSARPSTTAALGFDP